jgi:signal peptidase I
MADMSESVSSSVETTEVAGAVAAVGAAPAVRSAAAAGQSQNYDDTTLSEYLESLLVTVLLALFATTFILQAFKIPSPSMETTLLVGDHLLVNKFIFGGHGAWYEKLLPYRPLERGDIIVFKYPYQDHTHYVKRVIGLPGDHLKIVDQRVFINGKVLNEPYVTHDPSVGYDPLNYNFPPKGVQLYSSPMVAE